MKQIVWAFIAVLALAGGTGCHSMHNFFVNGTKGCSECGGQGCPTCGKGHFAGHHGQRGQRGQRGQHGQALENGDPHYYGQGGGGCPHCGPGAGDGGYVGPGGAGGAGGAGGVGQVTYPYYTTRGPRDFLQDNPTGIGPQ